MTRKFRNIFLLFTLVPCICFTQSVLSKATRTSDSVEPALVHPDQVREAQQKLDALKAKTGKQPNIVWLIVDDMDMETQGPSVEAQPSALPPPTWTGSLQKD